MSKPNRYLVGVAFAGVICAFLTGCPSRSVTKVDANANSKEPITTEQTIDALTTDSSKATNLEMPADTSGKSAAAITDPALLNSAMKPDATLKNESSSKPETDKVPHGEEKSHQQPSIGTPVVNETWTKQRLIVLAPGGPMIIDMSVNANGQSLEQAYQSAYSDIVRLLNMENEKPIAWTELLERPIVQSGWLGNLVPNDGQREQILNLYDKGRDGMADKAEVLAFLSRGAARSPRFNIGKRSRIDMPPLGKSTFGPGDLDEDGTLDLRELANIEKPLMMVDFNGDSVVDSQELRSMAGSNTPMAQTQPDGFLEPSTFIPWNPEAPTESVNQILEHYSFLETIGRGQWLAWTDRRWKMLDADSDNQLSTKELKSLESISSDAELLCRFFKSSEEAEVDPKSVKTMEKIATLELKTEIVDKDRHWRSTNGAAGVLAFSNLNLNVSLIQAYSRMGRSLFGGRIGSAIGNEQLKSGVLSQLELQPSAFDLADADGDEKFSPAEKDLSWQWFRTLRELRINGSWQTSTDPWFDLMDSDRNRSLTQDEIRHFVVQAKSWDRNQNERIEATEIPITAKLDVSNSTGFLFGIRNPEYRDSANPDMVGPKWFVDMDANRDGSISQTEFLGDSEDFLKKDSDKDGILSLSEVYLSP